MIFSVKHKPDFCSWKQTLANHLQKKKSPPLFCKITQILCKTKLKLKKWFFSNFSKVEFRHGRHLKKWFSCTSMGFHFLPTPFLEKKNRTWVRKFLGADCCATSDSNGTGDRLVVFAFRCDAVRPWNKEKNYSEPFSIILPFITLKTANWKVLCF